MWYNISVWCREVLRKLGFSRTSPFPNPLIPDFMDEFRPFFKNGIRYSTPTGHVSLVDPTLEPFTQPKIGVLSSHALLDYKPQMLEEPMNLLAPQTAFQSPYQEWSDSKWDELDDIEFDDESMIDEMS
ncbi:hypothetical protein GGR50DRAFT_694476 [Xylaria sp. CBS 124048]|nr:hypothetical protein GGR50DRAFT_694476 [Xylaria sp. CBS 124048]